MKIGCTVNLGNYESMKFDSGEHDNIKECISELLLMMYPLIELSQIKLTIERIEKGYKIL